MNFRLIICAVIVCCSFDECKTQTLDNVSANDDHRGELTEEDFNNADKEQFSREAVGAEMNDDVENLFEGDIILEGGLHDFDDVTTKLDAKWPKVNETVTIPYTFPSAATVEQKADIAHVIKEFERKTCIRFKKRVTEIDWVHLGVDRTGCRSHVGRKGGKQMIFAQACLDSRLGGSWGKLLHEVMHALGFLHEHTRPDRDTFVTFNWDQFNRSYAEDHLPARSYNRTASNFRICSDCMTFGDYDLRSVMHYPSTMGIQNRTVLTVKDGNFENSELGQRRGLSEQDVEDIHKLYDCRLTYDEHKDRCDAKIDNEILEEKERVRKEEKYKYCRFIDCSTIQATKLCPEECIGKNSSESGKWYYVLDVGENIILSHSADTPSIYCKFETPFTEYPLHLTRPTHPRYGDNLREQNGRIFLEYTPEKTCRVTVKEVKDEDSGLWKFTVESQVNGSATVKTFLHNVDVRLNDKQLGIWATNGTCNPLYPNKQCGPGYQTETRSCSDGVVQKCALSDMMRNQPCHEHDCPKIIGEWANVGSCNVFDNDEYGKCGNGKQVQTRSCQSGTNDDCTNVETVRILPCSEAGTAYPDCLPEHCRNYRNISDSWRKIQNYDVGNSNLRCDKDNDQFDGAKWFRFVGDAGTKLQTQPNPLRMQGNAYKTPCHTWVVAWLNGNHPSSQNEGIIKQKICFAFNGNQCWNSILYINLAKCEPRHRNDFYVYQLKRPPKCSYAYCAE